MLISDVTAHDFESVRSKTAENTLQQAEAMTLYQMFVQSPLCGFFATLHAFCVQLVCVLVDVIQEDFENVENRATNCNITSLEKG